MALLSVALSALKALDEALSAHEDTVSQSAVALCALDAQ